MVAVETKEETGYTERSSGRASVGLWGLFSVEISDLREKTAPRPPRSQGSIGLVAAAIISAQEERGQDCLSSMS